MFDVDFQRIESVLARTPDLMAAWVFGSAQTGRIHPNSDLDIALFFGEKPSLDKLADLRTALQEALHFDDIDLVILNEASPITRFEAVSGRPVYTRDASARAGFVSLTAREYEDAMPSSNGACATAPRQDHKRFDPIEEPAPNAG